MRSTLTLIAAVGALLAPVAAMAQSPSTTRIETRPFYGATVTLEEGVRVFRPLPPQGRVIINPGGSTPLNLSFEENRSISHNYNHETKSSSDDRGGDGADSGWAGGWYDNGGRGKGHKNGGMGGRTVEGRGHHRH